MGGGSWTEERFRSYSKSRGIETTTDGVALCSYKDFTQVYKQVRLHPDMNPKGVIRECRDSEEHPNTIPVILALDVTGSMGQAAIEVASQLNIIMKDLYKDITDVEFMVMGIGDFSYDDAPLQVSEFGSDIRIAEYLDRIYFEFGGGSNPFESYTAAWAFAASQTDLDCWKRGKKGIIITMGDEFINDYIPLDKYYAVTGQRECFEQLKNMRPSEIYNLVKDKYDVYHIDVKHGVGRAYDKTIMSEKQKSFALIIGDDNVFSAEIKEIAQTISQIIRNSNYKNTNTTNTFSDDKGISW